MAIRQPLLRKDLRLAARTSFHSMHPLAENRHTGRRQRLDALTAQRILSVWWTQNCSLRDLAAMFNVSHMTVYRLVKRQEAGPAAGETKSARILRMSDGPEKHPRHSRRVA